MKERNSAADAPAACLPAADTAAQAKANAGPADPASGARTPPASDPANSAQTPPASDPASGAQTPPAGDPASGAQTPPASDLASGAQTPPAARLFDAEYSLMELVWQHAPVGSTRLAALAAEHLGWKKSTTYTVLRKLAGRGVLENRDATVRPLITRCQALRAQAEPVLARCGGLPGFLTAFFDGRTLTEAEADQLQALIDASRARRTGGEGGG